ncbi:MAG: hypothetical protein ACRD68_13005, partial [Pyrinomonadaceae bacterium]
MKDELALSSTSRQQAKMRSVITPPSSIKALRCSFTLRVFLIPHRVDRLPPLSFGYEFARPVNGFKA